MSSYVTSGDRPCFPELNSNESRHFFTKKLLAGMESASFRLSSDWLDEQKAAVLFSPFRDKALNPHSWDKKMNFWISAVWECILVKNKFVWNLQGLTECFERKGKIPKCLDSVIAEMIKWVFCLLPSFLKKKMCYCYQRFCFQIQEAHTVLLLLISSRLSSSFVSYPIHLSIWCWRRCDYTWEVGGGIFNH